MKKNSKINLILFILLLAFIFVSAFSYSQAVSSNLSNSVFRLHVLANSDSEEDQSLKYKVRDKVIEYMKTLVNTNMKKSEIIDIVNSHLDDFKDIAESVIHENYYDYNVNVEVGNYEFPTKTYGDISFPAGYYDSLRIKIGKATGHNWWCVMFPPLCFVDVTSGIVPEDSKDNLKDNLSQEDYSIISQDTATAQFKFKIVELFDKITSQN